jgi:hypothetical protein
MANTDLAVRIATIFDSSGLKKADKSIGGFDKNLKKLAKTLGASLSASAVIAFGKASVKAFAEDEKSAAQLANTMKNLGLAFATPQMETFIGQLSRTAGVADDVLRPAMQKLINQTGDYFKSQELLEQAISISRGSGVELGTVVQDLANAYVGNTKGLKKYNLGLSQAELKTMDFAAVQKKLNDQFKGANAAYLTTYAGKMEVLKTAAGEAQETIGKGLVDSLMLLSGDDSVQDLADSMQSLAEFTSDAIYGFGSLAAQMKNLNAAAPSWLTGLLGKIATFGPLGDTLNFIKDVSAYGNVQRNKTLQNPSVQMFFTDQANQRLNNEKLKVEKKILDTTKKRAAEDKKAAAAKKQSALFDLEKIGLVAALQGKISEEEKLRLNLQLALLTGNDDLAKKLSAELANSIDKTGKLAKDLTTLPDAKNPFSAWSAFLDEIIAKAKFAASIGGNGSAARGESFATLTPTVQSLVAGGGGSAGSSAAGDVYITVNGSVLSEQDLVLAVQNGLNYNSLAGKKSDIGRIAGMFG